MCMCMFLLVSVHAQPTPEAISAYEDAQRLRAADPVASVLALRLAASGGIVDAQVALGVAHVYGQGGLVRDRNEGMRWLRMAAVQGHADAAYNLVALCEALPACIRGGEEATTAQTLMWLREAARQGLVSAEYEAAHMLLRAGNASGALSAFVAAARAGHAPSMYNAGHLCASGGQDVPLDLSAAVQWFHAAALQTDDAEVASDAATAARAVRRLWVQNAEAAPDAAASTEFFLGARSVREQPPGSAAAGGSVESGVEDHALIGWNRGAALWTQWQRSFASFPSYENREALQHLRRAMAAFAATLATLDGNDGSVELRRYLLLSKLAEGAKALGRDPSELAVGVRWLEELVAEPLCTELYATIETQPSCFNDQLAAAVTMRRRLNDTAAADALVAIGNTHPQAATHWTSQAQTPRVLLPGLAAQPWWDPASFGVAARLEEAWASGAIQRDLERIGLNAGGSSAVGENHAVFERIVSSGAPISAATGADADAAGVWSEFMIFDGKAWLEERCALTISLCGLLRKAPEVAGEVVNADGSVLGPQGQVTLFRLLPGAHVLPHVGVTNRRLVLQFPLRGWHGVRIRVADESRSYTDGRAMVFDDSFEHEVVHDGDEPRFVLYAVLHHPDLGTPFLRSSSEAVCGDNMKVPATSGGPSSERAREEHSGGSPEEPPEVALKRDS